MKFHPAALIFPKLSTKEFDDLKADIAKYGLHQPIAVYQGDVLDGRHRWLACEVVGVEPRTYEVGADDPEFCPWMFALSANIRRRHLNCSQMASAYAEAEANTHGGNRRNFQGANLPLETEAVAKAAGVSARTLKAARRVKKKSPALHEASKAGTVKVSDAESIIDEPEEVRKEALAAVESGESPTLKAAVKKRKLTGGTAFIPAEYEDDGEPVQDANGLDVPARLRDVFRTVDEFEEQAKALTKIGTWAKQNEGKPHAAFLNCQALRADLQNAKQAIRFNAPFAVCPYCQAKNEKCEACNGAGFVGKAMYMRAPSELRA